ncbi:MAG: DUF4920 domain-containing protein [Chitinophagaceae bacterium]|nr:MAG: DUF4920 domain-containing protein [Chitinophagaceae bacterium]
MKKILLVLIVSMTAIFASAQPPAGDAKTGDSYGTKVSPDGAIAIADAAAKLGESDAIQTKMTAKVLEVCSKKGCWVKLAVNDSTTAFVKMKDYGFFVPLAAVGKTVVIDGELKSKLVTVAELRHYAEDAKKSEKEIAAITKPQQELRVTANGITVLD